MIRVFGKTKKKYLFYKRGVNDVIFYRLVIKACGLDKLEEMLKGKLIELASSAALTRPVIVDVSLFFPLSARTSLDDNVVYLTSSKENEEFDLFLNEMCSFYKKIDNISFTLDPARKLLNTVRFSLSKLLDIYIDKDKEIDNEKFKKKIIDHVVISESYCDNLSNMIDNILKENKLLKERLIFNRVIHTSLLIDKPDIEHNIECLDLEGGSAFFINTSLDELKRDLELVPEPSSKAKAKAKAKANQDSDEFAQSDNIGDNFINDLRELEKDISNSNSNKKD